MLHMFVNWDYWFIKAAFSKLEAPTPPSTWERQELHESIIGQDEAVGSVSRALRRARAGLRNPARPMAGSGGLKTR